MAVTRFLVTAATGRILMYFAAKNHKLNYNKYVIIMNNILAAFFSSDTNIYFFI